MLYAYLLNISTLKELLLFIYNSMESWSWSGSFRSCCCCCCGRGCIPEIQKVRPGSQVELLRAIYLIQVIYIQRTSFCNREPKYILIFLQQMVCCIIFCSFLYLKFKMARCSSGSVIMLKTLFQYGGVFYYYYFLCVRACKSKQTFFSALRVKLVRACRCSKVDL